MSKQANILSVDLAKVTALPPVGMVTLRGDFADPAFGAAVSSVTGIDLPQTREIVTSDLYQLGWMSPDELLLTCAHSQADGVVVQLERALAGQHAMAVNVSDARAVFVLSGPHAREVLAKLAPVDLAPAAFKPGMLRRTRIAQVAGAFWLQDDETFHIVCFRSVAKYVNDLLSHASRSGTAVGHF